MITKCECGGKLGLFFEEKPNSICYQLITQETTCTVCDKKKKISPITIDEAYFEDFIFLKKGS